MNELTDALIRRLRNVSGLDERQAVRVLEEIHDAYAQGVDEFIARRHEELQRRGYASQEIYQRIHDELSELRFAAPPLTLRQIRRRIHG